MIDSHCHLDFPALAGDLAQQLSAARASGILGWVVPGYDLRSARASSKLAGCEGVHRAVGVHPYAAPQVDDIESTLSALGGLAQEQAAVALGECGLDKRRRNLPFDGQVALFEAQLKLAIELDLPLIVHQVGAQQDFQRCLSRVGMPQRGGVVHAFGGDSGWAKFLLARGFHLGFGPRLLQPGASALRRTAAQVPVERLLLETDAPDQKPPSAARGVPLDLLLVAEAVAGLRGCTLEALTQVTDESTCRLFGLPSPRANV